MHVPPLDQPNFIPHSQRILDSYRYWTGRELIERKGSAAEQAVALFEAPFAVLAHGTESDPILNYGNQQALELWEMDWPTFTHIPSRQTAEFMQQDARVQLLKEVEAKGFAEGYAGVRISRSRRRFRMEGVVIWNLLDENKNPCGQAAMFPQWTFLE